MNKIARCVLPAIVVGLVGGAAGAGDITLKYLGAIRAAEIPYGGFCLAYRPEGNGGLGSLYTYRAGGGAGVYEYTIPTPVVWTSNDPTLLPTATVLQGPIAGVGPSGLEHLPALPGQTSPKLYFGKSAGSTHGYMDVDCTNVAGPWPLSGVDNRRVGHYVLEIPESWRPNVGGKPLATGFGWASYGRGPDLYAFDPFPSGGSLPAAKLLEYDSTHTMTGWESSDAWESGAWVEVGSESAVLIGGRKVVGGEGRAQVLFYDPDDLLDVLAGGNAYDPQPYKAISVDYRMFGDACTITGMAYDRAGQVLYTADRIDSHWGLAIHAWEVVDDLDVPHAGDANADDCVDWLDYTVWADHYGLRGAAGFADGGWAVGNFNDDDVVDDADYAVWEGNYGYGGAASPEPAAMMLLAVGALALGARRRRRRLVGALAGLGLLAVAPIRARGEEWDWVTPMRHVHADYQARDGVPAREGTIAQFGDSITITMAFFEPMRYAHVNVSPADQVKLDWLRSYNHEWGLSWKFASGGTTVSWGLEHMDGWLGANNPEVGLIMWGTNDLYQGPSPPRYTDYLRAIVRKCKDRGTVPILYTIPPSHSWDEAAWVQAAREVAASERIPLIDYHLEIVTRRPHDPPTDTWDGADPMWSGYSGYEVPTLIACDGVHPSNWSAGRGNFDEDEGLNKNGFTLRNHMTLQKLYEVYEEVLSRPAPEPLPPVGQITYEPAYLGGGQFAFTLTIHGNDFKDLSFGADVSIEPAGGGQIDPASSSFLEPFLSHAVAMTTTGTAFRIEAGTGPGSQYEQVDLARVVADDDLVVSGEVARDGASYGVDLALPLPRPGDANLDGEVDVLDLTAVANHFGRPDMPWSRGDFNDDDLVDVLDLVILANHFGGDGGGQSVPEPSSSALVVLGLLLLWRGRRR